MGREVRRVPPNWEHPKDDRGNYRPLIDESYTSARQKWLEGLAGYNPEDHDGLDYWEWNAEPDRNDYRPYDDAICKWFQLYETITEGTPCSPPFETEEELAQHMAQFGDGNSGPWGIEQARAFVKERWAPTGMIVNGQYLAPKDFPY